MSAAIQGQCRVGLSYFMPTYILPMNYRCRGRLFDFKQLQHKMIELKRPFNYLNDDKI